MGCSIINVFKKYLLLLLKIIVFLKLKNPNVFWSLKLILSRKNVSLNQKIISVAKSSLRTGEEKMIPVFPNRLPKAAAGRA